MKTIASGDYVDLVEDDDGYEYLHESNAVIIIPVKMDQEQYGVRKEVVPPYGAKSEHDEFYTLISGTVEGDEDPVDTMWRELEEEAGMTNVDGEVKTYCTEMPVIKSSDIRMTIKVVLMHDYTEITPPGDGTMHESMSKTIFVGPNRYSNIKEERPHDFLFDVLACILRDF